MNDDVLAVSRFLSVGHSQHELPRFLELLRSAGVTAVADVRSSPFSQRLPQFNRPVLEEALREADIAYAFLGSHLGGRPRDPRLYDAQGRADYEKMRATETFRQGLELLVEAGEQFVVAMLCSEGEPLHCHRGLMIAPALAERGLAVGHIRKDGSVESAAAFEQRLLEVTGVGEGLLDGLFQATLTEEDRRQLLAEAYRVQARKVAFRRQPAATFEEEWDATSEA